MPAPSNTRPPPSRLPPSLWAATATPPVEAPPLATTLRAEVCIVGGGFTGLSAALHLAEAGAEVVLLEAAEPGWGASGRNGGQIIPGLKIDPDEIVARYGPERGERLAELAGGAPDFLFDLIERHGIDCGAERCGWIQAAHGKVALRQVEARAATWSERGADVMALSPEAVTRLTGAKGYAGGLLDGRGGRLQPLSYARGLARAAQSAGAAIHGGSPAAALTHGPLGWEVTTPTGRVLAKQALLCTNGYTDGLWPGLAKSVIPIHSFQAATRPLSDNLRRTILPQGQVCSDTRRLLAYFRIEPDGRLIVGGRGRARETSDPRHYGHVLGSLRTLFPQLGEIGCEYFWGGRVAMTPDQVPHLHEPAPGLLAGLGYNGRGVAMATVLGKILAERAQGTPPEALPFPTEPVQPIPLHGLRLPAIAAAVVWKRFLDKRESDAV